MLASISGDLREGRNGQAEDRVSSAVLNRAEVTMSRTELRIPTPDGEARAFAFRPQGRGPWPPVIFYMDAPAIRPALFDMCERLAGHGYFVLLPDMLWSIGQYDPINLAEAFKDEEARRATIG